jgi:hypothetical protein
MEKERLDRVIQKENCTIRVYRPALTDEERERRMEEFKKATAVFLYQWEKSKRSRNGA